MTKSHGQDPEKDDKPDFDGDVIKDLDIGDAEGDDVRGGQSGGATQPAPTK